MPSRRRRNAAAFCATLGSLCIVGDEAMAAGAAVPVGGLSLAAAAAVALAGLVFLAGGLARMSSGTAGPAFRFGAFGMLGRFGRPDRVAGEANIRRAVTSILVGIALLGAPEMLGAGIVSQTMAIYRQNSYAQERRPFSADITPAPLRRTYENGGGEGSSTPEPTSFPWWIMAMLGLIALIAIGVKALSRNDVRSAAASPTAARSAASGRMNADVGDAAADLDLGLHPLPDSGGMDGDAAPRIGLMERLAACIERIRKRIRILLDGIKQQIRLLADETEEQKGRFRPLAAFAVQQAASLFRALADRDDGGSGLPPAVEPVDPQANAVAAAAEAFAEKIGLALSLQGANLTAQIAKAVGVSRRAVEADLHRLGAAGVPTHWVRVTNSAPDRPWLLAERPRRPDDGHFDGVIAMEHIDWFATLSVEARQANVGMPIVPLEGGRIHLATVRDARARALADAARENIHLPDGGEWTLADIPLARIQRHFGEASDGKWIVAEKGVDDEILVFDIRPGQISILSGADRLRRAISSAEDPVRALVHTHRGGALASLGIAIDDIVPAE